MAQQVAPHHVAFLDNYMQCKPMIAGSCSDTICNAPNPRLGVLTLYFVFSLNPGMKRIEFPLKTDRFPGLKPYIKFPAHKTRTIRGN